MKLYKVLNISSQYSIDGEITAYFNAQIEDNGDFTTNRNISDQDLYRLNREEINNAYSLFEDEIYKIVDKVKQEGLCA